MFKIQMVSGFLAMAVSAGSAFAQATAVSPTLPQGHRMISACDNKGNPAKYGSLSAVPRSADKTLFAIAPYLVVTGVFASFVTLPFGEVLIAADLNIGLVFFNC